VTSYDVPGTRSGDGFGTVAERARHGADQWRAPIYLAVLPGQPARGRAVATVVGINLATHPLVWIALGAVNRFWWWFGPVELAAAAVETGLLWVLWPRAARPIVMPAALLANAASCLAGLLIYAGRAPHP